MRFLIEMFNDQGKRTYISTVSGPDRSHAVDIAEQMIMNSTVSTRVEISTIDNLAVYIPKPSKIKLERQPDPPF